MRKKYNPQPSAPHRQFPTSLIHDPHSLSLKRNWTIYQIKIALNYYRTIAANNKDFVAIRGKDGAPSIYLDHQFYNVGIFKPSIGNYKLEHWSFRDSSGKLIKSSFPYWPDVHIGLSQEWRHEFRDDLVEIMGQEDAEEYLSDDTKWGVEASSWPGEKVALYPEGIFLKIQFVFYPNKHFITELGAVHHAQYMTNFTGQYAGSKSGDSMFDQPNNHHGTGYIFFGDDRDYKRAFGLHLWSWMGEILINLKKLEKKRNLNNLKKINDFFRALGAIELNPHPDHFGRKHEIHRETN